MNDTICPCRVKGDPSPFQPAASRFFGAKPAETAEALMRSRYSAFARGEIDYSSPILSRRSRGMISIARRRPNGRRRRNGSVSTFWASNRAASTTTPASSASSPISTRTGRPGRAASGRDSPATSRTDAGISSTRSTPRASRSCLARSRAATTPARADRARNTRNAAVRRLDKATYSAGPTLM